MTEETESAGAPAKPIVWAFCNGVYPPSGDQQWIAVADSGELIHMHVSSDRTWGISDVGPQRRAEVYRSVVGTADVDFRVIPEGEAPSPELLERMEAWWAREDG